MDLASRAALHFQELQERIVSALQALDGGSFRDDAWTRAGGGGGRSQVLQGGALFEKAGVNFSDVHGSLGDEMARSMPGEGASFRATGMSLVLHPVSPMIPTVHANFRCFQRVGAAWFGGGADLTPVYPYREDVEHFHRTWKGVCDRHDPDFYKRFKKWCDEYFYLPHRGETRGVGGLFFDYLEGDLEKVFGFVRDAGEAFLPAYLPILERRRGEPYGEREREFQQLRRGRYVEFNLLYDRGTVFGLKTAGRIESILMSLPAIARWQYMHEPEPGSREAELAAYLKPTDWLGLEREIPPGIVGSS